MKTQMDDPRLTAYALGELDGDERGEVEALVASSPAASEVVEDVRRTAALLEGELAKEPAGTLGEADRQRIEVRAMAGRIRRWTGYAAAACVVLLVGGLAAIVLTPADGRARNPGKKNFQVALDYKKSGETDGVAYELAPGPSKTGPVEFKEHAQSTSGNSILENPHMEVRGGTDSTNLVADASQTAAKPPKRDAFFFGGSKPLVSSASGQSVVPPLATGTEGGTKQEGQVQVAMSERPSAGGGGRGRPKRAAPSSDTWAQVRANNTTPKQFINPSSNGGDSPNANIQWPEISAKREGDLWVYMDTDDHAGIAGDIEGRASPNRSDEQIRQTEELLRRIQGDPEERRRYIRETGGEAYDGVIDSPFLAVLQSPLSTFSIDVDTASYSNVRRMLNGNQLPPAAAVRIEEMVNYFSYDYPQPEGEQPFSVNIETASCPWKTEHRLIRVGLKGRVVPQEKRLPCNLVFLIDVSGSMDCANKLPLVKQGLAMLVQQLSPEDRVAMVVYAGASGLALPSTPVSQKDAILSTIEHLEAGGSTNGGEGIQLAYKIAGEHLNKEGVNRVILATDGDFNVGVTDQKDLVKLVEEKAKGGVFLSVLGFGMGNLKDAMLEKLADKGNGNYAYIDTFAEAKKVLVDQMGGTLVTIAKDVKIQIEFNPGQVAAYRLIGYENRILAAADFNNDKKDAGEIGAGHTVTALYEIVPTSASTVGVDPLKYQPVVEGAKESRRDASDELMTLKLRYKRPDGDTSRLIESPVKDTQRSFDDASDDLKFAASVAGFGMLLRNSPHKGDLTYDAVLTTATRSMGKDGNGYRAEFVDLVRKAKTLSGK